MFGSLTYKLNTLQHLQDIEELINVMSLLQMPVLDYQNLPKFFSTLLCKLHIATECHCCDTNGVTTNDILFLFFSSSAWLCFGLVFFLSSFLLCSLIEAYFILKGPTFPLKSSTLTADKFNKPEKLDECAQALLKDTWTLVYLKPWRLKPLSESRALNQTGKRE